MACGIAGRGRAFGCESIAWSWPIFGDCEPVGEGVSEMRIHYGPGYRVYLKRFGLELVVLLAGGEKSTQSADIALALKLARQLEG